MMFGDLLRQRREERGLSRQKLADVSGVKFGTIHSYEIKLRSPSFANIIRLAAALGVDCTYFAKCEDLTGDGSDETSASGKPDGKERPAKRKPRSAG